MYHQHLQITRPAYKLNHTSIEGFGLEKGESIRLPGVWTVLAIKAISFENHSNVKSDYDYWCVRIVQGFL